MALEEQKALVRSYTFQGMTVQSACAHIGISKHQYYYTQNLIGKRGVKSSVFTKRVIEDISHEVSNEEVVKAIIKNQENADLNYGYKKMTVALQIDGYMINNKKVRRLMTEQGLLKKAKKPTNKSRVKFRKANSTRPLEIIEMDIKYIPLMGHRNRYVYVFTIIDTFTREVLYWTVGYQMKQTQIRKAWEYVILNYLQPAKLTNKDLKVEIRSDNGSQFEAIMIQDYFKENGLNQVFTHPYTPQENGHIESFHAILGEAIKEDKFTTLEEVETRLNQFYKNYNEQRLHGSTCNLSPKTFKLLWENGYVELIQIRHKSMLKLNVRYCEINKLVKKLKNKKKQTRVMRA